MRRAAAWPLAARAQQADKMPTIGFFGALTPSATSQWTAAFVQRLRELGWIEGRNIAIEDFRFDPERNIYLCPAGKVLPTTGYIGPDHAIRYQASLSDCRSCVLKPKCCPKMPARRIVRDVNEDARTLLAPWRKPRLRAIASPASLMHSGVAASAC